MTGDDSPSYSQRCGHRTVQLSVERMKKEEKWLSSRVEEKLDLLIFKEKHCQW